MKRFLLLLVLTFIIVGNSNKTFASHIPGANITYTCDPNNPLTYTFTLTLFRICPGTHPATMAGTYFSMTNTCGLTNPVVPTFNQVGVATDVNQLCATATSDCSGGTSPGVWKYTYEATITLPANCDSWTIAYDLCCRDASTNMSGGTGNSMATSTTMYTATAPCNSSPVVSSIPMPYACASTTFNHCIQVSDPEGDSVYFSMVPPAGAGQAPIANLAPWSSTAPLTGFVLNPLTGCFSFNEPLVGDYVVAIQINSYDSNGNLIASVIHDFKIIVMACNNTPPTNPLNTILNISGTATQTGPASITACYGDTICFDVQFSDPTNPTDVITIQQDGTTLFPGATFTQTGTNPATGTFCWVAQPGYTGSIVTFIGQDDGCPVMGTSGFAVDFDLQTGVYADPDPFICGTQSATLGVQGASAYTWSPPTGLSCTNCASPIATPSTTTTYTVTGNLSGTCPNVDQITVNVVPDFPVSVVPANATICANEVIQLTAGGPGAQGPYTISWTPSTYLNNPAISNPLANPLTSTTYTATITSAAGCTKTGDANITVSGIGPTVTISPDTIDICAGEAVPLTSTANVYPLICGPSAGCTGTTSPVIAGNNTLATSAYDIFYGSTSTTTNYTSKVQYIYTAAELNAQGYYGGTIRDLALRFTTSYTYTYDNVEIWIGCTALDQFASTTFESTASMTQVYGPVNNINPTNNGWHTFNISDFDWDGVSNIIVQFCGEEDNTANEGSESVQYTSTTPFYRCLYDHSAVVTAPSCAETLGSRVTNRPNMRFNICTQTVTSPTYAWSPGAGISNTSIPNPTATPGTTTSYVLDVTNNGCTGSGIVQINVSPDYTISPSASPATICYGQSVNLATNETGPGPYTYNWEPSGAFANSTIANPTVTPTGPTTYYIETSNGYCRKLDSITVNVGGLPTGIIASEDTVCQGDLVNLTAVSASPTCGINYSDCTGSTSTGVTGTNTSATTVYGPFYGSTAATPYTFRRQYIVSAAELTAMGFGPGMITGMEFDVTTSFGRSYNNIEVWMGCTSMTEFTTTSFVPVTSMDKVYDNPYYTTQLGWNMFDLTGFNWDGTSNIIIQICGSHQDKQGGENTRYSTTTPYYRTLYYSSTIPNSCGQPTGSRVTWRPNMRFTMCTNSFGAGATYSWSPATYLSGTTGSNTTSTPYTTTTYTLTVNDPAAPACPTTANITVAIDNVNTVTASPDTMVCPGDNAPLNAVFTGPVPTSIPCGLNGTTCSGGPAVTQMIGTGTTATSTYGPFYGSYNDVKYQFLYHASDLQAMGLTSGTITDIAFNLLSDLTTGNFSGFTIRMGCTTNDNLVTTAWEPTQGPVWGPQNYNPNVGINNFNLNQTFDWDGTSNIVIECCFNNNGVISYANHYYSTTPGFYTTMRNYVNTAGANGCTLPPVYRYTARPNVRFTICPPPPAAVTYSWSPSGTLNNGSIANPIATPATNTSYAVTVTGGVCTVYDTVNVTICNPLPIDLGEFSGRNNGLVNELFWNTITEENNDYFGVQHSIDGVNFTEFERVDGAGNSMSPINYSTNHMDPVKGLNYYRLRQTDFDGSYSYSNIVAINTNLGNGIQFYPNPSTGDLFMDIDESNQNLTISVSTVSGSLLFDEFKNAQQNNTYKVDMFNGLKPGVYIVHVKNAMGETLKVEKVIKH